MMQSSHVDSGREQSRSMRILLWFLNLRVVIPCSILLLLIAAPFVFRVYRVNALPDIGHPFDVEGFGTVEISDEQNAFVEYHEASNLMVELETTATSGDEMERALEEGWSAASEDLRSWVDANNSAMESWKRGAEKPEAVYHQPKHMRYDTPLPVTQNLRDFARLTLLKGSQLQEAEEYDAAWRWYRTLYRSSRHSGRYGSIIERLVGAAMLEMSAAAIEEWSRIPQVTSKQLERSIEELQAIFQMTAPTSDAYKVEYLCLLSAFEDAYSQGELEGIPRPLGGMALYTLGEPELSIRVAQHLWANQLAHIDKPLHERPTQSSSPDESSVAADESRVASNEKVEKALRQSVLGQLLLPATWHFDEAVLREQVRHGALLVAIAAQQFQRDRSELPETVENLLDGYLDQLPFDPHDPTGAPLKYRRNSDGFTVWGIGTNQTDDGGNIDWDIDSDGDFGFHIGDNCGH